MSHSQTITEWTVEKCLDKRVQSKQTPKHNLANQTNTWSKVQADVHCPSSKKQTKSIKKQLNIQTTKLAEEFRFMNTFVYATSEYMKDRIGREIYEDMIDHRSYAHNLSSWEIKA